MIKISINVKRINKDRLKPGKNGQYLDLVLFDKPDNYGNDGFVAEDVSKDERAAGIKGNIIGNWKHIGGAKPAAKKPAPPPPPKRTPDPDLDAAEDEIPF